MEVQSLMRQIREGQLQDAGFICDDQICDAYQCLAPRLKAMPDLAILAVSQDYNAYRRIPRSLALNAEVAIAACR